MSLFEELNAGSFRGASFLIKTATTSGGRKQAKHEYPNSDRQKIEDLGFKPKNFKISAIITPTYDNSGQIVQTYLQKKAALIEALDTAGEGTLSHPFFFSSFQVTARPYTIKEDTTKLEVGTIEMDFDISDAITNPIASENSLSEINKNASDTGNLIAQDIANDFSAGSAYNFSLARTQLDNFSGFVDEISSKFAQIEGNIDQFSALLSDFQNNVTTLIQLPQALGEAVLTVISSLGAVYDTIDDSIRVASELFDFGDNDIEIEPTTVERAQAARNQKTLNNSYQTSSLALCYQLAAERQYTTVNDVDSIQQLLENQYEKVTNKNLNPETMDLLNTLRTSVNNFLAEQRLNASQIIQVKTKELPLSVIGYQYYENLIDDQQLRQTLFDLNKPKSNDNAFLEGEINVVTV